LEKKEKKDDKQNEKVLLFEGLNIPEPPPCPLATNNEQVKVILQKGVSALNEASEFYVMDGYVTEHIEIYQEISALYRSAIAFDPDLNGKSKLHKKRVSVLEPLIDDLNSNVYMSFYQQLTDEVGHAYSELVELKLAIQQKENNSKKTMSAISKLNDLVLKAIAFFQLWFKTFEKDGKAPESLDPTNHKAYLTNLLIVARLHSKLFNMDPKIVCSYLDQSLHGYKKVVEVAENFKAKCFDEELNICKQMIELLPIKIIKINTTGIPFQE